MASRKLSDLCPELKEVAEEFIEQCAEAGIDVLIYCTYRSNEEQDKEYEKGRDSKGNIINRQQVTTYAKGGGSKHNRMENGKPSSRAFDCVAMRNGFCLWSSAAPEWKKMGEIGRGLGLEWGGDFRNLKDRPHFQLQD